MKTRDRGSRVKKREIGRRWRETDRNLTPSPLSPFFPPSFSLTYDTTARFLTPPDHLARSSTFSLRRVRRYCSCEFRRKSRTTAFSAQNLKRAKGRCGTSATRMRDEQGSLFPPERNADIGLFWPGDNSR